MMNFPEGLMCKCVISEKCEGGFATFQCDFLQGLLNHFVHDLLVHIFHAWCCHLGATVASTLLGTHSLQGLSMLGGNDYGVDLQRLYRAICFLQVLDGHLCLAIRTQPPQRAILTHICQLFAEASCHRVCQRHAILRLITGIAKHDTLITSTNIHFIFANMDTSSNIWALLVGKDEMDVGAGDQGIMFGYAS